MAKGRPTLRLPSHATVRATTLPLKLAYSKSYVDNPSSLSDNFSKLFFICSCLSLSVLLITFCVLCLPYISYQCAKLLVIFYVLYLNSHILCPSIAPQLAKQHETGKLAVPCVSTSRLHMRMNLIGLCVII